MHVAAKLILCLMIGGVGACAQGDSDGQQAAGVAQIDLGLQIDWPAIDGAVEYRVQVWDGVRLLFEETREQPVLPVTDSMRRSLTGAVSAGLQVRGFAADGRQIGVVYRRDLAPGGG
ncbi:hypothetical protein DRQ53_12635 [bacterium]|nr:MAG: hypothetical protein DRQ53_12635 [bacterium]